MSTIEAINVAQASATLRVRVESPLIHGGGNDGGNTQLFRRQSRLVNGEVVRVPVVSGNALRGVLRRAGAWALWDALDRPTLTADQARVLSSGGNLAAAPAIPLDKLAAVRTSLHHVTLFGAAWGGQIHDGSLIVGHLFPDCAEFGTGQVRAAKLLDRVMLTRHDRSPIPTEQTAEDADTTQMIYEVEALCTGATLSGSLSFRPWATPEQRDWAALCFQSWVESGAHIGGKSAAGHGTLTIERRPEGIDVEGAERALAFVRDNRADVLEAIRAVA